MNTPSNAGKEHNPWDRKPHEYGAPEWRLLNTDEAVQIGDEYNCKDYRCEPRWAAVEHTGYLPISHTEYRRRTTPPTREGKECGVCGFHLPRCGCTSTPPTQSQEGETPRYCIGLGEDGEPDFKTLVGPRGFYCDLSEPEDALWCRDLQPAWDRLNELEATLTAAQRENDRLRKLIEDAPHDLDCQRERKYDGNADKFIDAGCTCWKSRAATEEGKRG